jgi:transposase-like protein
LSIVLKRTKQLDRKLDAHQREEALKRLAKGETLVDVARTYGVDPTTPFRRGKRGRVKVVARAAI